MRSFTVLAAVVFAALAAATSAFAHAHVSPSIVPAKESQVLTLAVPTEKEGVTTTKIELTPPQGLSIDSFVAAPGWSRVVQRTGSGEEAVVTKVTWLGGKVPTGEATGFEFLARTDAAKTYSFAVRQTYSDGSVVDWTGAESSDTPAPLVAAKSSFGGGGTSTVAIVALVLGAAALVLSVVALLGGKGTRPLA